MPAAATDALTPALLPGAHRVIRAIDSHEGPFVGVLVTRGDAVAVRVDAATLAGWEGWRFGGSEHVAGPLDLVRRAQGHDVLLPWCTEKVSAFVGRRTAADVGLSSGECSTLLVSLFRALEELGEDGAMENATGAWWLTDEGRPVFVLGEGVEARAGVTLLVAQLGENCADKTLGRLLGVVQEGLRTNLEQQQRRVPRLLLEKWEGEVLEVAAPRVLRRAMFAPERADTVARAALRGESSPLPSHRVAGSTRGGRVPRGVTRDRARARTSAGRFASVPGDVMRWVRGCARALRPPTRRERTGAPTVQRGTVPRPRRRSLLVAAGAAIAVLLGGLLWPSGATSEVAEDPQPSGAVQSADPDTGSAADPSPAAERPGASADHVRQSPDSSPSPVASRPTPESEEPAEAASWLLAEISRCADAGDAICAVAVAGGSAAVIELLADGGAESSDVELVDEYGDAAVVRLTPKDARKDVGAPDATRDAASGADQILVLVRINEKWLVRDVYDVADQPE
ncbi:hypothetical protein ACYX8G_06245 [Microbacterium saperdae]